MSQPKSTWRYRMVRRPAGDGEYYFAIAEEHTAHDGSVGLTEDSVAPHGDTPEELRKDLEMMLAALELPVIIDDN